MSQAFGKEHAERYDERNSKLSEISNCLHFLTTLTLKDLPKKSKILCVGAGTGAEILTLARAYPEWEFVALDPSAAMLDICRERLTKANIVSRTEFFQGYIHELPKRTEFDAVLSILVSHFIKHNEKQFFFQEMSSRLKSGGYLINAEISFDLESKEFSYMLKNWESVQTLMGATPESISTLSKQLKDVLAIATPEETENLLRKSDIPLPLRFFQAFMISAWYGQKS
ncbi:MAG: class I SAM-dependent methyltransferase [Oligoflexia bacterium]|nr:class I SAM-dependent methyltransferase [Oligoflexia bacterium]